MIGAVATIPSLFEARVASSGAALALRQYDASSGGFTRALTWREWHEQSLDLAAALQLAGAARGASLAILAHNVVAWPLADVGGILAGMVTVGIYPTSAPGQVRALLQDAAAVAIVVDSALQLEKVREATTGWESSLLVIADVPSATLRSATDGRVTEVSWTAMLARGHAARAADPGMTRTLPDGGAVTSPDDIAMLIYTSGSTGVPKGARLSHRCVVESARSVRDTLGLTSDDSSLSYLPMSHAGERLFGLYTRIMCGMPATLVDDVSRVWEAGAAAAPTLFGGMPRLYEKVYERLLAARADADDHTAARWDRAVELGRQCAWMRRHHTSVPPALEAAWGSDRAVMIPVLDRSFGARLRLATSGGAALPVEVAEYLDACGVTVLGAYGQTEHLCATFNRPACYRHDSVGAPMPGTTLRVAPDGEVQLLRSALTFSGYHGRPDETRSAFTEDGLWLRTGDLGVVDSDGFLRITGRTKDLIALSSGTKVAPLPIEARLCDGEWISHAMVFGEGHAYLVALLVLRWPLVERWQHQRGIVGEAATLVRHPALVDEVTQVVARVNAGVSRPEWVRKFVILPHALSADAGEITPTHKLRRSVVASRYRADLESLYRETA